MAAEIKTGFSMHPYWLGDDDLPEFIDPLRQVGLSALEFELDPHLPAWEGFQPLMEAAVRAGLDLSFHAPFRKTYTLQGFAGSGRTAIEKDYRPMLAIADQWGQRMGSLRTVVLHAAVSRSPVERETLKEDTLAFIEWALKAFPDIRLALENNSPPKPGEVKVGDTLAGVLGVIGEINDPRLQACWDFGHDFLSRGIEPPPPEWLASVVHAHVHDVNIEGVDHYPLMFQRVPWQAWLPLLKNAGKARMVVLELKGGQLQGREPNEIQNLLTESISDITRGVR